MQLLDGKKLSKRIQEELGEKVDHRREQGKRAPHLAAVLVGEDPASSFYIKSKVRACDRVGFQSTLVQRNSDVSQDELLEIIRELNHDEGIDGFIVQLPLPAQIDEVTVNLAIDPSKDVDGFHPVNVGRMVQGLPCFLPATPNGIIEMFRRYKVPLEGKHCVVLGRSQIVGTPISILLSRKTEPGNATVTLTHSRTKNIRELCLQADIIISAIGKAEFVTADMVKEGAVVIDVGINRVPDENKKKGYRLTGDVDFDGVAPKCSYITPVPGGVGLMTVTSLLMNAWKAASENMYQSESA